MPSNAEVNVIPGKLTTTGASSGYLKTSDGASSFEVVSQIPSSDVEGGGSGETLTESYTFTDSFSAFREVLLNSNGVDSGTSFPQLAQDILNHNTDYPSGTGVNLPLIWINKISVNSPYPSHSRTPGGGGTVSFWFTNPGDSDLTLYLLLSPVSGGNFLDNPGAVELAWKW